MAKTAPTGYSTYKEAIRDSERLKRRSLRSEAGARASKASSTIEVKEASSAANIREREASESARQVTQAQRSALRTSEIQTAAKERVSTQQEVAGNRRTQRIENAAVFGAANSSIGSSIGMIVALFFAMIIIYVFVKNGSQTGTLLGSIGTFVHGLSSNSPLFVQKTVLTTTGTGLSGLNKAIASSTTGS